MEYNVGLFCYAAFAIAKPKFQLLVIRTVVEGCPLFPSELLHAIDTEADTLEISFGVSLLLMSITIITMIIIII